MRIRFTRHLYPGFIASYVLCTSVGMAQDGWELKKDRDGVRIYTRKVTGSVFHECRGETTVDAPLPALVAVYQDVAAYPEWMPNLGEARLLDALGDTLHVQYIVNPAPWPVADRDAVYVFRYRRNPETGGVAIDMESSPDFLPAFDGNVRIERALGSYRFTPREDGTVDVLFRMHVEPGGNIPALFVNMSLVSGPFKTLSRLRERARLAKYRGATFSFFRE